MDLLKELNDRQKEAVLHGEGPLLVIAGAGAGKTKVITHRIAYLIKNGVKPETILAVTFTNKAANEMKERIINLLKSDLCKEVRLPTVGTFHSLCARVLRENSHSIDLPRNFSILDKEDSLKIIKRCLKKLDINPKQFQPAKILAIISGQKSKLVTAKGFEETAGEDFFPKTISMVWQEYEENLKKQKSLDFDDLIAKTVFLFRQNPEILEKYHNKWRYILIDEYQDTNHSQYVLAKLLAQKHKNICVVGDEDQSIYGFRGANFGNILNFEKDRPGTKTVMLEQNYRSTQKILDAANAIIGRNKMRKPKNLFSRLEEGKGLIIFDAANEREEAEFIVSVSKGMIINEGVNPSEIAVLYRANFQSRSIEEAFLNHDIPYQVVGTKFFERKEIKNIIAYIKAALNPNDILSMERVINEPPRGIGKISLMNYFSNRNTSPDKKEKIEKFLLFLQKTKNVLLQKSLSEAIVYIIDKSGYKKHLNDGTEEGLTRIENINELIFLSAKYSTFKAPMGAEKFLEDVALMSDQDTIDEKRGASKNRVRLMTVHAAKGLEFSCVFISGLEEGLFPFSRFGNYTDKEEERRLFYVALTRAKQKAFLSFAYSRNFFGGKQINKPSRFINEIPPELFSDFTEIELPTTNYLGF